LTDKPKGFFKPGNKYGRGRPAGSKNNVSIACQNVLDGEAEAISRRCVEMALAGDSTAMRLCMERIVPAKRDRPVTLNLPSIRDAAGVSAALDEVLQSTANGSLTIPEASGLSQILEARRRSLETVELEGRLAILESQR